jgi:MoaA/NifB/PqqE/SkfB family radical SAM enzyme
MFVIPIDNQLSYHSIPRNNTLKYSITNHCNYPSRVAVVDWRGNCFVCSCEAWLPITVGNIMNFTQLSDIWSNSVSHALQKDIDDKKFSNCAVDRCGILYKNQIHDPYYISINIDESCNLRCPSCRKDSILHTKGPEYETKLNQVRHLVQLLEDFKDPIHIVMSGNGDPLASNIMRPLIHEFEPRRNQTIRLFTNGLLLEKQLTGSSIVDNITQYFISIDAGSAAVYENVRRPGRWDILLKNFDFLKTLVKKTKAEVLLKFVLQQDNWQDMQNFVDTCNAYGFKGVINRLEDWGTWDKFSDHDVVGNSAHPDHTAASEELRKIYQLYHDSIQFNPSLIQLCQTT